MDTSKYKPIYPEPLKHVDILKSYDRQLFTSLCVPSAASAYSMCIEYMSNWLKSRFQDTYFKSTYMDGKDLFDDFRRMTRDELLKRLKPALTIVPQLDTSFDRERLDMNMTGLDIYSNQCNYRDSFFKDFKRNAFIGIKMEILMMNFSFRIKVSTRAQELDLFKFMKNVFRVGSTQGKDIDMDFHVPYKLMMQVADDCGFAVKDGKIVDIIGFMCYLNKNSQLPFLYKLRGVNQQHEFFIKLSDMYVHINCSDLSMDDGERENQIMNNFIIEMQAAVRFPCPKFYSYYSLKQHEHIRVQNMDGTYSVYDLNMTKVPAVNAKGWNQFMTTEYSDEDSPRDKPIVIKFDDLVGDIRKVIDYTKSIFISPAIFVDIKLYNDFKEVPITIDWQAFTITTSKALDNTISFIAFYIDTEYLNTQLTNIEGYNKNRLNKI